MVFILGVNLHDARLVKTSLQFFYGIGPHVSERIMARFYIHPSCKLRELNAKQVLDLNTELASMRIENELRREMRDNIARLRDMGSYRGRRHAFGLPVRGQRTRTQVATAHRLNRIERKN